MSDACYPFVYNKASYPSYLNDIVRKCAVARSESEIWPEEWSPPGARSVAKSRCSAARSAGLCPDDVC